MIEYQLEFNGLTIGPGTSYPVQVIEGLGEYATRLESNPRTVEHGGLAIAKYLDAKTITLRGHINSAPPGALLDALKAAFAPQSSASPLRVWLDTGVRQINVLPTRFSMVHEPGYKKGYVAWIQELHASDPRQYADAQSLLTLTSAAPTGTATNDGNITTYPLLIVEGGTATNPSFTNNSETVKINRSLASGERLVVDFAERTIKVDGVSVYASLDPTSVWWDLEPGGNNLSVNLGGTAQAKFYWRSAWL